jgi:integrase
VAASTPRQARRAILLLYQQGRKHASGWWHDMVRATQPQRLPVVCTQDEVATVLRQLSGVPGIMGTFRSGAGLRRLECRRLRVTALDVSSHHIVVRDGKGQQDRVTRLPQDVTTP